MNPRIVTVLGLAAVVLAAGCSSGSSGGATHIGSSIGIGHSRTPHPRSSSPTPTATVTTPTPTPTVTVTAPAGLPSCTSSQLSLSLGPASGAAGSTYTPMVFTNSGSKPCSLGGYPGVSFVDASGALLGKPAHQDPGKVRTVKLTSGGAANALLREPEAGNFPPAACHKATTNRLRVYPPGESTALFLKYHAEICTTKQARTGISPIMFGGGG